MEPIVGPEEMAAADRRTIAAGTPIEVLMERAGRAVAWAVRRHLGGAYGRRAVVVCGKGNNGGDGLVAARALRRWGMRVHVAELAPGIDRAGLTRALARADVAIDAMYGTGLRGGLGGDAAWVAAAFAASGVSVVAVDIPSGVNGRTGATDGVAVRAHLTVTFAAYKPGLLFHPGRTLAGRVEVADIGIDLGDDADRIAVLDATDVEGLLPARAATAHKWAAGVMVVGGSGGMTGAPTLAARAALHAGASIVFCALPGVGAAHHASGAEVIARALPATDGNLAPEAVEAITVDLGRFRALALGPGLGGAHDTRRAVTELVTRASVPLVLDADGLNALAGDLAPLMQRASHDRVSVLTPHDKEFERLAGEPVGVDRITAAQTLADRAGAVVLLKGATTVIAEPAGSGGRVILNVTGTPDLATAGSGDVLTGIVAAFVARGVPAFEAAAAAAWVHGRAAELVGPGLVAGDIVDALASTLAHETWGDRPRAALRSLHVE
ncbi:MAG: NAD(P)H-hydrate dehydratase [Acidimicrobiia bacterium]